MCAVKKIMKFVCLCIKKKSKTKHGWSFWKLISFWSGFYDEIFSVFISLFISLSRFDSAFMNMWCVLKVFHWENKKRFNKIHWIFTMRSLNNIEIWKCPSKTHFIDLMNWITKGQEKGIRKYFPLSFRRDKRQ